MSNALRAIAANTKLAIELENSVCDAQRSLGLTVSTMSRDIVTKLQTAACPRFVESIEVQGICSSSMYAEEPDVAFFHDRVSHLVNTLRYSTRDMGITQCTSILKSAKAVSEQNGATDFNGKFVPLEFKLIDQFQDPIAVGVVHNDCIDWLTPGPAGGAVALQIKAAESASLATVLALRGLVAASQSATTQADQLRQKAALAINHALAV